VTARLAHLKLFPESPSFLQGMALLAEIAPVITGRVASEPEDCGVLCQAVNAAGGGDHVEIGTLYGGTAILVALAKERWMQAGRVTCIDPLRGYYASGGLDPAGGPEQSPDLVRANARLFGVEDRIELVTERSDPWPEALRNREWATAFVDGWHWGDAPLRDLRHLGQRVTRYIVVDNYDRQHPAVVEAVREFTVLGTGWTLVHTRGLTAVLERDTPWLPEDPVAEWGRYK
jgi:hypothetical protein